MQPNAYIDLNACTEFRQALRSQTPAVVHVAAVLSIATLIAAISWMAATDADLVVTGAGRVRPVSDSESDDHLLSHEISTELGGRVVEVGVAAGDEVSAGDLLVRFDTSELDIQIEKVQAMLAAGNQDLDEIGRSLELLTQRHTSAVEKAETEIEEARAENDLARKRRDREIALAKIALAAAQDKASRARQLGATAAISQEAIVEAETSLREAEEKLRRAELPVSERQVSVLLRGLDLIERDYAVEQQKLVVDRQTQQEKIELAALDLAKLRLERDRSIIRADSDGVVTESDVRVGDVVAAGKLGMTMAHRRGLEFELQVSASDVAHLRTDMPVRIKLDAFDYQKYGTLAGTVRFVAPDSTLKEAPEGRQVAVYTVKVALSGEELRRGEHRGQVKLGMTGKAEIVTDNESILTIMVRKIRRKISLR